MKKILFYFNAFATVMCFCLTIWMAYILRIQGWCLVDAALLILFFISTILCAISAMYCE